MPDDDAARIATAVILQAMRDIRHRHDRNSWTFLTEPSEDLTFWCDLAGLDETAFRWSLLHICPEMRRRRV